MFQRNFFLLLLIAPILSFHSSIKAMENPNTPVTIDNLIGLLTTSKSSNLDQDAEVEKYSSEMKRLADVKLRLDNHCDFLKKCQWIEVIKATDTNLAQYKELVYNILLKNLNLGSCLFIIFRTIINKIIDNYKRDNFLAKLALDDSQFQINEANCITLEDINTMIKGLIGIIATDNMQYLVLRDKILDYVIKNYHIFNHDKLAAFCAILVSKNLLPDLKMVINDSDQTLFMFLFGILNCKDNASLNFIIMNAHERLLKTINNNLEKERIHPNARAELTYKYITLFWQHAMQISDKQGSTILHYAASKYDPSNQAKQPFNILIQLVKSLNLIHIFNIDNNIDLILRQKGTSLAQLITNLA